MRGQFIKGDGNKQFEIVEESQANKANSKSSQQDKLHRYDAQLDKLSKATKDILNKK